MKPFAFSTIIVLVLVLWFGSCKNGPHYLSSISIPATPTPMTVINSTADDYNSDLPIAGLLDGPIVFSSNRDANNFNIVYKNLFFDISYENGGIYVTENTNAFSDALIVNATLIAAVDATRTSSDEFGPHLIPYGEVFRENADSYNTFVFLYSSGIGGNQNIRFLQNRTSAVWSTPQDVKFLNSDSDDAYPTFLSDTSAVYFCSNRGGNFDIYKTDLDTDHTLLQNLADTISHTVLKDDILSSPYDDKCPMIYSNVLVFTSNRPGGYGGFDLYYSLFEGGKWTAPINFGKEINSISDEYRPTIKKINVTTNDLMVFSSNRTGGMGGFDLYYVGIPKLITSEF